jgi:hypothetical protein
MATYGFRDDLIGWLSVQVCHAGVAEHEPTIGPDNDDGFVAVRVPRPNWVARWSNGAKETVAGMERPRSPNGVNDQRHSAVAYWWHQTRPASPRHALATIGYLKSVSLAASFLERNTWLPGVVVAIALFLITTGLGLYWRSRDRDSKHLDFRILSDTPIVTRRDRPEILKVMFGSTEVNNPYITEVRFKNTGKQVIESSDFLAPLTISRQDAKVLDFNGVDESEPGLIDAMEQTIDPQDNNVKVMSTTLNSGDWFTVQVIYDVGKDENTTVTGRIKGQTRSPQQYQEREGLAPFRIRLLFGAQAVLALGFVVSVAIGAHSDDKSALAVSWLFLGLTGSIIALLSFVLGDVSSQMARRLPAWLKA